ncbi:hypothetical protein BGW36DRAFT_285236 [Talaromyces proteolyticus]|uniref:Uncharacterized protein n=1 Tax=Talaromyces proteolyticus TaxID=1131652 RepID=A0AAD4Q1W0_9EURO|nr:uncharacterized protein BGW36DRAFT_285236 [Talaromyces proteolyticus]KAH8706060.1 hypothetical protein BGW36DRAFT_285236 [Talaromyces proteolyticus]
MAYLPTDAFQCFTYISENVPSWITRVTELTAHTAKKHAEFSEEYKKLALTQQPQRPRKNSSFHSIRPGSELRADRALSGDEDAASAISSEGAGVLPRQQLIIYYDGHTQKELEQVGRDIGAARNSLRKGKMSPAIARGRCREPYVDLTSPRNCFSSWSPEALHSPQLANYNSIRVQAQPPRSTQKEDSFDFTDRHLASVQSLCETAAHRFIRCGNCSAQLKTILAKFDLVLGMAKNEVDRLNAEKQVDPGDETAELELISLAVLKPVDVAEDGMAPDPGSAAIEVDDSLSDSSVSIDITAFRSSRFRT